MHELMQILLVSNLPLFFHCRAANSLWSFDAKCGRQLGLPEYVLISKLQGLQGALDMQIMEFIETQQAAEEAVNGTKSGEDEVEGDETVVSDNDEEDEPV